MANNGIKHHTDKNKQAADNRWRYEFSLNMLVLLSLMEDLIV